MSGRKPVEQMTDDELLEACDEHEAWHSDYEKDAVEKMMGQRPYNLAEGGTGRLFGKQRAWAVRLLEQLDARLDR